MNLVLSDSEGSSSDICNCEKALPMCSSLGVIAMRKYLETSIVRIQPDHHLKSDVEFNWNSSVSVKGGPRAGS